MNRLANLSLSLVTLGCLASTGLAQAPSRTLILLQENSGKSALTDWMPPAIRSVAQAVVDQVVEFSESAKFALLAQGSYQRFINLSDTDCSRANLLSHLIAESHAGRMVDLAVLGHGRDEELILRVGPNLTGATYRNGVYDAGSIRRMLVEARQQYGASFQFSLRTVYMCNCRGGTLNDDWLAIGAKVAIGSVHDNYMPEPMISDFWSLFVKEDSRVEHAAAEAYQRAARVWQFVPDWSTVNPNTDYSRITGSQPIVSGNRNLIFRDECQMAIGETRSFTIRANQVHNLPNVFLTSGQQYQYTTSGTWRNGNTLLSPAATNANGYTPGLTDFARRHSSNMMCLVGERCARFGNGLSFLQGSQFRIGASNTLTAAGHGFLVLYANDMITGYGDNIGSITLTIRRLQ